MFSKSEKNSLDFVILTLSANASKILCQCITGLSEIVCGDSRPSMDVLEPQYMRSGYFCVDPTQLL